MNKVIQRAKWIAVLGSIVPLLACESPEAPATLPATESNDAAAANGVGGGANASGNDAITVGTTSFPGAFTTQGIDLSSAGAGGAPPLLGQEDSCDGLDNDANGVIDDVDVGGDGICDCLRIATLGAAGPWGEGDVFDTWLDARSNAGAVDLADTVLTAESLNQFQVIVAQDLSGRTAFLPEEVSALKAWVQRGGGFMTLIGYGELPELANVNALLEPLGLSYASEQILERVDSITRPVTGWMPHPVTEGITSLGVDNGYPVVGGNVLATEQGFNLLSAVDVEQGHVLVWGDEWITYNSEWTEHPDYQVELFWVNAIKWLTPISDCQVPIPDAIK